MSENFQLEQQENELDLKKEFLYFSYFWPYFLVSIIIAFIGASLYLRYTPKVYTATAQIQFKKSDADPTAFLAENAGSLFDFDKVNLDNGELQLVDFQSTLGKTPRNFSLSQSIP